MIWDVRGAITGTCDSALNQTAPLQSESGVVREGASTKEHRADILENSDVDVRGCPPRLAALDSKVNGSIESGAVDDPAAALIDSACTLCGLLCPILWTHCA